MKRTLGVFDRVVVAIARNPDKDRSLFDLDERLQMIRQVFKGFGDRVEAESFDGLLVEYAKKTGAKVIIRGLRAVSDFEYEFQMAMMNRELAPGIATLFMMTGPAHFSLSPLPF